MILDSLTQVQSPVRREEMEHLLKEAYLAEIFAYASRRLPRREDAEDATAETFQAALAKVHRMKDADPRLWLYGIARRKVADMHRRAQRRREVSLHVEIPFPPSDSVERDEARREMRRIVLRLPEDQREALLLQYLEDLSHGEIAKVMKRSPAAVNSLLQRARAQVHRDGRAYFQEFEGKR